MDEAVAKTPPVEQTVPIPPGNIKQTQKDKCIHCEMIVAAASVLVCLALGGALIYEKGKGSFKKCKMKSIDDFLVYPIFKSAKQQEQLEKKYDAQRLATVFGAKNINKIQGESSIDIASKQIEDSFMKFPFFRTPAQQSELEKKFNSSRNQTTDPIYPFDNKPVVEPDEETKKFMINPFFRTDEEQAELEKRVKDHDSAKIEEKNEGHLNDPSALPFVELRQKRERSKSYYHACCKSSEYWINPTTVQGENGDNLSVVQFPFLKQYFYAETCEQQNGCDRCRCSTTQVYRAAVVTSNSDRSPHWQLILLPGCCKCYNTA